MDYVKNQLVLRGSNRRIRIESGPWTTRHADDECGVTRQERYLVEVLDNSEYRFIATDELFPLEPVVGNRVMRSDSACVYIIRYVSDYNILVESQDGQVFTYSRVAWECSLANGSVAVVIS